MRRGVSLMVGSAFFFALMAYGVRALGKSDPDLPILEIVLFRASSVLLCSMVAMGFWKVSWKGSPGVLLLRSLGAFAGMTTYYICLQELPLGIAVTLQQLNPAFATLLGALCLGEGMARRQLLCLAGAFSGVALMSWAPVAGSKDWSVYGVVMGVVSALIAGAAYVLIRRMIRQEPALRIVAWTPLVSLASCLAAFCLPSHLNAGLDFLEPAASQWGLLVLVGLSTFGGQITLTMGLKCLPAGEATTIAMVQVPMALLIDLVAFHETPSIRALGGIALVISSVTMLARNSRHEPAAVPVQ